MTVKMNGIFLKITFLDGKKPYACSECGKAFRVKCNLRGHIRVVHEGKKNKRTWKCSECHETFTKNRALINHMSEIHDIRYNECSICFETFESNVKLTQHLSIGKKNF